MAYIESPAEVAIPRAGQALSLTTRSHQCYCQPYYYYCYYYCWGSVLALAVAVAHSSNFM